MGYSTYGRHVVADLWGVEAWKLDDKTMLCYALVDGAKKSGATVLDVVFKKFEPQGATVMVILSESHVSIHTYPEKGFAAVDCYTCGESVDPQIAIDRIIELLKPNKVFQRKLYRGIEAGITG